LRESYYRFLAHWFHKYNWRKLTNLIKNKPPAVVTVPHWRQEGLKSPHFKIGKIIIIDFNLISRRNFEIQFLIIF
jgi:hypothetical protein